MTALDLARPWLACPVCKGALELSPGVIRCVACTLEFPQSRDDCIDLLPGHVWDPALTHWGERQRETECAYRDLIGDPAHAILAYRYDYGPFAPLLATYRGLVLDVGGGNGLVRHHLPSDAQYVVVDPSLEWLGPEWTAIAGEFPCLREQLCFVRGVGEYLPFAADSFDAALAFWSLNHASRPASVFDEARRVLRPGGRFLLVLEDMPPRWRDIADGTFPLRDVREAAKTIARKLFSVVAGWPVQTDHIRIRESELLAWSSRGFEIILRAWLGAYLAFELRKTESPPTRRPADGGTRRLWSAGRISPAPGSG